MGRDDNAPLDLSSPAAYGRAFADVYDHWYHDVSDAEAAASFIATRCRQGMTNEEFESQQLSVVEFGVGTGRLAGPMTRAGLTVFGIDASMPMLRGYLDSDQEQATALVVADMRAIPFRSSKAFHVALIAFNTLFNVVDDAGQAEVLAEARALIDGGGIGNGGLVIIEALTVDDLPEEPLQSIGVRTVGPTKITVSATQVRGDQTMTGQHLELSDEGVTIRPWILRWLTTTQLDELAASVGLHLVERYSTWDEQSYLPSSTTHISVYATSEAN